MNEVKKYVEVKPSNNEHFSQSLLPCTSSLPRLGAVYEPLIRLLVCRRPRLFIFGIEISKTAIFVKSC